MAYNWGHWSYLYQDKKPVGRERKYCLVGEQYVNPELQDTTPRSCFFKKDQIKIGQLQRVFPVDRLGRKIFFQIDRLIVLTANQEPLLVWEPLYIKGKTVVLQCINPGYSQFRIRKKPSDLMVISGQLKDNYEREQEEFELVHLGGQKTGYQLKE